MDYEKKYNEAFEKARRLYEGKDKAPEEPILEYLFPELREDEDERIRKEIIDFLETIPASELKRIPRPISEWFSWLEKQKEQKLIEQNYDNRIQYDSVKSGIEAFASTYSFNIESKLFSQLTKEQQRLWREEIEQAAIAGGEYGIELSRDNRYKENRMIEWSEEDKKLIDDVINSLCCYQNTLSDYQKEIVGEEIRKLKSFRPVKQEWSEEDEKKIIFLERLIKYNVPEGQYGYMDRSVTKLQAIAMLKSLRPSWKPSERQMKALKSCFYESGECCPDEDGLRSLYEDLKKLM